MPDQFQYDVFLSHSSKDKAIVRSVAERLRADGLSVWFDEWELKPGDSLPKKIDDGLEESCVLVLCMSVNAFGADWAQLEAGTFRFRDPLNKKRRFIPLRLDDAPIKGSLQQFLYINWLSEDREQEYAKLLEACRHGSKLEETDFDRGRDTAITLQPNLTIIVSVYNESEIIKDLVKGLKAEGLIGKYRILLCDDGSTDSSFEIMHQCFRGIQDVTCIRNRFNSRKVGAIDRLARMVRTPFLLTLDADCMLSELQDDALGTLMRKMSKEGYSAACFRIVPNDKNWLGRLQKLEYSIFTDTLRQLLGIPVCLIGQGVLWKTDSFLEVLSAHSGAFHGDDLENTIIALSKKMAIHWERESVVLSTIPKKTIMGLAKQRALSWDFGMLRVLLGRRALSIEGESGAFYKNLLLMDFLAHPFRLIAVPVLLSVPLVRIMGLGFYDSPLYEVYRQSLAASFKYGSYAIVSVWTISVVNSFICVRWRIFSALKWSIFNAVYLFSPFVYLLYYRLVVASDVNAYDVLGASEHWLGLGLLLTYLWWVLITFCLVWKSSLQKGVKSELILSGFLAPIYFFALLVFCKTIGILKYLEACVLSRLVVWRGAC